jgi:2-amino-4-hydroxy-6-hydroxymethyldihydropteridine diphosphokinase
MKLSPTYIALGANLPWRNYTPAQTLIQALEALAREGVEVITCSDQWHSPAWPNPSDPPYINAVAEVRSGLSPRALLDLLHRVEADFGRTRQMRWESRSLDLDLIDYRGEIRSEKDGLVLPHPRAGERGFVLLPLQQIAPSWQDPMSGASIDQLISALSADQIAGLHPLQSTSPEGSEGLAQQRRKE